MNRKLKIKKGDSVLVIAGDDKGKSGRVLDVYPKDMRILVEDVNIRTVHLKPSQKDQQGGRKTKALPIHYSNVQLTESKKSNDTKSAKQPKKKVAKTKASEL